MFVLISHSNQSKKFPREIQKVRFFRQIVMFVLTHKVTKEFSIKNGTAKIRLFEWFSNAIFQVREIFITPSNTWGGQGLLGISIRFCSFEGANENVWHILQVEGNSPAEQAGLRSHTDYIIGADSVLHESEDLFTLIEAHEGRQLKLYVYNTETDHCREVTKV